MREFSFSRPAKFGYGRANVKIGTMSELADIAATLGNGAYFSRSWQGGLNNAEAADALKNGHLPSVKASDEFLNQVEQFLTPPSARHVIADDVVGAFPNIPAYLAGQPLSMRRKFKTENEAAPIALIIDTTSSAGISPADMARRGAAMLALARALSNVRPVELYACTGLGKEGVAALQYWRIDTAPLDLARAAFLLAHPAATRGIQYTYAKQFGSEGAWPYSGMEFSTAEMEAHARIALPDMAECMCVPPVTIADKMIKQPVEWLKEKLFLFTGEAHA